MGTVAASCAGALSWTLLEYMIHRWLGHDPRLRPNPFATEHVRHHAEGNYFAPAWKKAGAAVLVVALFIGPATLLLGGAAGTAYVVAFVLMYLTYEWAHRRLHTHAARTAYGRWARRHHFHHHFVNPRLNHGVTSVLWDLVWRTRGAPKIIRVPTALAPHWLRSSGNGQPEIPAGYELLAGRSKRSPSSACSPSSGET